jgi:hypothetical protein
LKTWKLQGKVSQKENTIWKKLEYIFGLIGHLLEYNEFFFVNIYLYTFIDFGIWCYQLMEHIQIKLGKGGSPGDFPQIFLSQKYNKL